MKRKLLFGLLILSLVAVPLFATACEEEEPTPSQEEEEEQPPAEEEEVEGDWWDEFGEPQYGGTITFAMASLDTIAYDPYAPVSTASEVGFLLTCEQPFWWDWTLDRSIWAYQSTFIPEEYATGLLAESWEQTDQTTLVVHLREGVYWQDKEPANGREFVASDVVEHYNRQMGWGDYTEPNAQALSYFEGVLESVTATDDHTVVFKASKSVVALMLVLLDVGYLNTIECPESVEADGGVITNWENSVGTGPWIITDHVSGTSLTFTKNPNYWGYDERHPENQLPYADEVSLIAIADMSTRLAALRTGQVDYAGNRVWGGGFSWQQAESIAETDPELELSEILIGQNALAMRVDNAPFTDIRVRKALQMSINRTEIAETYYGGYVDGTPAGLVSPTFTGWCYAYDEWSQELQDEYSYNPTLAAELLAEAAADGIFEQNEYGGFDTNVISSNTDDLQLLQIVQSYFLDIGVDMEIKSMDAAAAYGAAAAGENDQMYYGAMTGYPGPPMLIGAMRYSTSHFNFSHANDAVYDAAYESLIAATTLDEAKQALRDLDKRSIETHWTVYIFPPVVYSIYQPYLMGYSGELIDHGMGGVFARLWVDLDMKESMGR